MATTIKSTALDFDAIKNNLKTSLSESGEFTDYNFEASGLSNIPLVPIKGGENHDITRS